MNELTKDVIFRILEDNTLILIKSYEALNTRYLNCLLLCEGHVEMSRQSFALRSQATGRARQVVCCQKNCILIKSSCVDKH
jgi:hypothetical protein